jgi:hypothetical protein
MYRSENLCAVQQLSYTNLLHYPVHQFLAGQDSNWGWYLQCLFIVDSNPHGSLTPHGYIQFRFYLWYVNASGVCSSRKDVTLEYRTCSRSVSLVVLGEFAPESTTECFDRRVGDGDFWKLICERVSGAWDVGVAVEIALFLLLLKTLNMLYSSGLKY